jgi:hypothetical protein
LGYPTKQKQQGQIFGISQDIPKNNNKSWDILFFLQVILVCQKKLGISQFRLVLDWDNPRKFRITWDKKFILKNKLG